MAIQTARTGSRGRSALRELLLVAALFLAYKAGRLITMGHVEEANRNTVWLWRLERLLRLPNEASVQHVLLSQHWLVYAANCFYAYAHFPTTAICLIWLYVRHPERYRRTRWLLAWLTAAGLAVHIVYPLAPPRLTPALGLIDTGIRYGPGVYGSPATDTLSNQYAAMPSLHVGWAVVVAAAVIGTTRHRLRWLWLLHPVTTLAVVVATGNHYWLDAVVALLLLAVIALVLPVAGRVRARQRILEPALAAGRSRRDGPHQDGAVVVVVGDVPHQRLPVRAPAPTTARPPVRRRRAGSARG